MAGWFGLTFRNTQADQRRTCGLPRISDHCGNSSGFAGYDEARPSSLKT